MSLHRAITGVAPPIRASSRFSPFDTRRRYVTRTVFFRLVSAMPLLLLRCLSDTPDAMRYHMSLAAAIKCPLLPVTPLPPLRASAVDATPCRHT